MSKVATWSTTAGSNNSSPPDGWPEGMQRSAVNDCAREMMSALARWYTDQKGTIVSAGSSNAYTLTTTSVYAAIGHQVLTVWRADRANTGAVTLSVDGLTAKNLLKNFNDPLVSGDIEANQLMVTCYNANTDTYEWVNPPAGFVASTTLAGQVELATAAEVVTGTDAARVPSVSVMTNHEGVAKAWASVTSAGTVSDSYGVTGVVKNSTGVYTVTLTATMANATYAVIVGGAGGSDAVYRHGTRTTTTFVVNTFDIDSGGDGEAADEGFSCVVFGTLA